MKGIKLLIGCYGLGVSLMIVVQVSSIVALSAFAGSSDYIIVLFCAVFLTAASLFNCVSWQVLDKSANIASVVSWALAALMLFLAGVSDVYGDGLFWFVPSLGGVGFSIWCLIRGNAARVSESSDGYATSHDTRREPVVKRAVVPQVVAKSKSKGVFGTGDDAFIGQTSAQDEVDIFDSSSWGDEFQ